MTSITLDDLNLPRSIPRPERNDWRIGVIGYGGIARPHTEAYLEAGWNIVAVADPDPEARERAEAAIPGVRTHADYRAVIDDDAVEVVSLLTQPTLRLAAIEAAFAAGKPVLVEKPLANTREECEDIVALADRTGIPIAVSQNYRWNGGSFYARSLVEQGYLGNPYYVGFEIQGNQDVMLRDHPYYAHCEHFLAIQWNIHMADLMRFWLDRDPRRVFTVTRRMQKQNFRSDNLLLSVVDFGEGVTGHVVHSELLRSNLTKLEARIDGDAGSIVFDLYQPRLTLSSERTGPEPKILDLEGARPAHSMSGPMGDLLISIETGREPATSARSNLATIKHVFADIAGIDAGGAWVPV